MTLQRLDLYNFGPYRADSGEPQSIRFPEDPQRRVMAVFGDNERGKTSVLNALRWVLYDKALDRYAEEIGVHNLLNREALRDGDRDVWVALRFEHNGHVYDLRRHAKVKDLVAQPRSPADFERTVLLQKNGSVVQADRIEQTLNEFVPEEISRFYLFDGELLQEYEALLHESPGKSKEIREAVERVLGVPALTHGRDEIKKLLKDAQRVQAKDRKRDQATQSHAAQSLRVQDEVDALELEVAELKKQDLEHKREMDEIKADLDNSEDARVAQARLNDLKRQAEGIAERDEDLRQQKADALKDAWRDLLQPLVQVRRRQVSRDLDAIRERTKKRGGLEERVRLIRQSLDEECPLCGTVPDEGRRKELGEELGALQTDLRQLDTEADRTAELGAELDRLASIQRTGAAERLRQTQSELDRNDIQLIRIETEVAEIEDALRSHDVARIAELQRKKDGLVELRARIKVGIEGKQKTLDEKQATLERLSKLMGDAPTARHQTSTRTVEVYEQLAAVFEKSVDKLRERLRTRVETHATEAFAELTNEPTYTGLRINDQYGLSIIDKHHEPFPIRSAGAEQVVAMSLLSALNKSADRPGPVVIDTPFGRLDPHHRLNILSYLPTMSNQVVLLVHEGEVPKDGGLDPIADRIGAVYDIERVTSDHSRLIRSASDD